MTAAVPGFAARVMRWQQSHGRHDLPWQNTRDPYRVWLSEIMLQQTQVSTVLDYYPRFLARFATLQALAAAPLDEVLALWSGLGYYSRARHLHGCAQAIMSLHGGEFPRTAVLLQTLPGIGRSTAAAIAAFCFGERVAILDGNVRRVLSRVLGFEGDLSLSAQHKDLWDCATELLPQDRPAKSMPCYTQGLMDLGAGICATRQPRCPICPVQDLCVAHQQGRPESYPVRTRKLKRSAQSLWLLQATQSDGSVWLEQRPTPGVWAGLYCLPVFESYEALAACVPARYRPRLQERAAFVHVLTHKDLHLHPVGLSLPPKARPGGAGAWMAGARWPLVGLPAPVRKMLVVG